MKLTHLQCQMLLFVACLLAIHAACANGQNLRTATNLTSAAALEAEHVGYLTSRRRLEHAVHAAHPKAWMALETVDGLRNEDVVVFITSTTNGNDHFLWDRIIPSARTWMKLFANVFVVVEDNFLVRYALRHCLIEEYPSFTTFDCHNEPVYLLTRTCTNEYYAARGICCKIDAALHFLINEHVSLFQHTKYVIEGDDDTYFRPDQILRWLAVVDNAGLADFPLVANHDSTHSHTDTGGIWHITGCTDIFGNGWYQPMVLNHAALQRLSVSSAAYGFTHTCTAFSVSQDVGFGPYAWMMELVHIHWPRVEINGHHQGLSVFRPDLMVVHCVRHVTSDFCDQPERWPAHLRYNQSIAVGCGDLSASAPFHNGTTQSADMYEAWHYFQKFGTSIPVFKEEHDFYKLPVLLHDAEGKRIKKVLNPADVVNGQYNGEKVEYRVLPLMTPLKGYKDTAFAHQHDLTKEWTTFTLRDCKDPGRLTGHTA